MYTSLAWEGFLEKLVTVKNQILPSSSWQMRKSERQLHSPSWKTLLEAEDRGGSDVVHAWNVTRSHDKLFIGNPMVSEGGLDARILHHV